MEPIKVGLLGFGTVGCGTYTVLRRNQEEIKRRAGRGIEIARIAVRNPANAAQALPGAQALGYAEADPTFDIEGVDAAHKATIMSAIAFGVPVQFDKADVEGISQLAAIDIRYADELGYRIKLLGITRRTSKVIE